MRVWLQTQTASSIPARYHTFVEIDHEIISTVILLPSADLFKKGCCQLQAKVCAQITGEPLAQACPGKSVVKWTDRPAMTIAVDIRRNATKTNKIIFPLSVFIIYWSVSFLSVGKIFQLFSTLKSNSILCMVYYWFLHNVCKNGVSKMHNNIIFLHRNR